MINFNPKFKKHFVTAIKILIVVLAFYFIYFQIKSNSKLDWQKFSEIVSRKATFVSVFILLVFSVLNRFLEILKWQNLVSSFKIISIWEATKQVLGALTAGIFTPNGLGEYAGKAFYFPIEKTKSIIFLNLICNGIQMFYTILFGIIGLFFLGFKKEVALLSVIIITLLILGFVSKKIKLKGYSIEKIVEKTNEIPKEIHLKNTLLGFCRYLVFSHQYYFLFLLFDVQLPYFILMATIAAVYFLASSLPSFQVFDFAVKGSVAVFFFQKLGVDEWIVVFISFLMWFLNVVLPVIFGSYFVLKFKPKWN